MKYIVSGENAHQQYFKINFKCKTVEETTVLTFPNWRPGRYQAGNFAKNIKGFKVLNGKGKQLKYEKISSNRWEVDTHDADSIEVEYLFYAAELNAGSTFLCKDFWYMNPVNCCIYVEELMQQSCIFQLEKLPQDYQVASSAEFNDKHQAEFDGYHELVDTPFIASASLQHHSFISHGKEVHLWFQGELRVDWEKILGDFQKFTDHQIAEFTEFPGKSFHFLIHILPYSTYHGVEHLESTVITLGPTYDVFGKLYKELLGVSSHELYHCWNVKTIRPKEWMPYNYAQDQPSRMGYLAEGVTTYMGDLELFRSKVFTFDQYKAELEAQINKHLHNYGRFNHSVSESSYDTWLDGYELGAPHRKVSIYTEGCLLAFFTDVWIMKQTQHRKGLQEVMRRLFFNFGMKGIGVSESDYKAAIEAVAEAEFTEIWKDYFYGTASYERLLAEALDFLGLEMVKEPNSNWVKRHLGVLGIEAQGGIQVKRIAPGSRADLAGLIEDDVIIGVNGKKLQKNINEWLEYYQHDEIHLTINRKNNLLYKTCPHLDNDYFSEVKIIKLEQPDKHQETAFGRWSRETKNY